MIHRTGVSGLKVRQVAARAGVNLGMFHYHFGSKREFNRRVLESIYGEFFGRLSGGISEAGAGVPRERLKRALLAIARFGRENRGLLLALLRDLLNEDAEVLGFVRRNFPRHIAILVRLVRECQRAGIMRKCSLPVALTMLAGGIMSAPIGVGMLERVSPGPVFGLLMPALRIAMVSDRALEERVETMLDALRPPGRS